MKQRPTAMSDILDGVLPRSLAKRLPPAGLLRAWQRAAGPVMAGRAMPVCVEQGGVLVVAVSGSAWMQEVRMAGPKLCERLDQEGYGITQLKLISARTPAPRPPARPSPPELSPEDEAQVAEAVASLKDPDLKQAMADLYRASIRARKAADT